jgi:hypothetical protein
MHCLLGCIALSTPRVVIVLVVIFSDYIGRAYDNLIWPLLGFMFMPTTTLAYAWAINARGSVDGIHLAVVIVAVFIDLGLIGGSSRARRSRERRN